MKAAIYEQFQGPVEVRQVVAPAAGPGDVIVRVKATGLCRSDWHGWMGHDADVRLPHVPGHELAGVIEEVGREVRHWRRGDRVTVPFCLGCGRCPQCQAGQQQVCDQYFQPGFTGWGSFAEFVRIPFAAHNLVRLPDDMAFDTAAVLGCRFITSYRGVVAQGRLRGGEWVAVHGCGGVGLSAIMIAVALGASVAAIDIDEDKLGFARRIGAAATINARTVEGVPAAVREITRGGAHLSVDALGSRETCQNSILCLRKRGRHIQIGLMAGPEANPRIPMHVVIARELEILGSHGMQAHQYPGMLQMIQDGKLHPQQMIGKRVGLEEAVQELMAMDTFRGVGVTVAVLP
ncbi:MAG: zinc-dependent alcohol dehydrogenase family protein [Phaeodactylibacter sp.]|nr:zinc-dependent alcohol dehydrogenase family protein [Phaeodactylibacter sp.]